jgi:GT2 family glycosyltransferase/peptidoglycan/xylan/chitin deacetylase (PgdA/CDA1 family)
VSPRPDPLSVRFSIVIPTYQRRETVLNTVLALRRQVHRDFEVVVVVDGSTDGTADALRDLRVPFELTVLEQANQGGAAARNAGAAAASGELLLFLDDDMEAEPAMVAEHDRSHRDGADLVLGDFPIHPDSPTTVLSQGVARWARRRRELLATPGAEVPVVELITGQMSIPRSSFEGLGGFDVSFTRDGLYGCEDLDFGYRARQSGLRIVFNPDAVSRQLFAVDPADFTRRTREAGRAKVELAAKHPELVEELTAELEFTTRRSRLILGVLARAPAALSWPLRAFSAHLVRSGRLDFHTYRLFFGVQTMESKRGRRQGRRRLRRGRAVVLVYHSIGELRDDPLLADYAIPPARFAEQIDMLAAQGRRFISQAELLESLQRDRPIPPDAVLVTFDDCYADLLSEAVPALAARGIPAVAFAVSGLIGETNEWDRSSGGGRLRLLDADGLRAASAKGIAIGSHGATHRRLTDLEQAELEHELEGSAERLAAIGIPRPVAFSYPYGVWSRHAAAAVRDAGYSLGFTLVPGVVRRGDDRHALPRIQVFASDTPRLLRIKIATAGWPARWRGPLLRRLGARVR